MKNRTRILGALLKKEFILMRRTRFIPPLLVMMPLMVMLVIPLVADMDVRNVGVVIVNNNHSQLSRRIIADINSSEWLNVRDVVATYDEAIRILERGETDIVITVPPGFPEDADHIQVTANDVNAMKGTLGAKYASESIIATLREWRESQSFEIGNIQSKEDLEENGRVVVGNLYNPTLNYRNYMLPAIMVVLLIIICGFLPTLNLVGEKETGTIDAINVSPVGRMTFVLSKLIPYWLAGLVVVTIGILVARLVYGLAPEGSVGLIYLAAVLFTLVMSGLGVAIANRSETMLQAIFVMFAVIMIFQLMGGLFTPISSMPDWARLITYLVPPRYFNEIMRSVYLKGSPLSDLWVQFINLGVFAVGFCLIAALTYRKRE